MKSNESSRILILGIRTGTILLTASIAILATLKRSNSDPSNTDPSLQPLNTQPHIAEQHPPPFKRKDLPPAPTLKPTLQQNTTDIKIPIELPREVSSEERASFDPNRRQIKNLPIRPPTSTHSDARITTSRGSNREQPPEEVRLGSTIDSPLNTSAPIEAR